MLEDVRPMYKCYLYLQISMGLKECQYDIYDVVQFIIAGKLKRLQILPQRSAKHVFFKAQILLNY